MATIVINSVSIELLHRLTEMIRTCLTSHTGFIHSEADTHTCCRQKQFQETSCALAFGLHAPGLTKNLLRIISK